MGILITLELKKMKNTFANGLVLLSIIAPVIMIVLVYSVNDNKTFFEVFKSNSVFVQMIPFAVTVIYGCFIVAREYKDNTMVYIKITPQSPTKIVLSKLIVIIIELSVTQLVTFVLLSIINAVIDGFDMNLFLKYINAGLVSVVTLSALVPLIVLISIIRQNFSSASLIFLLLFMFTFPFIFSENGYIFPHLLPMILVAKSFGNAKYDKLSFLYGSVILIVIAIIFLYLLLRNSNSKE